MPVLTTKLCTKCQVERGIDQFREDARYKDGYHGWCRSCRTAASRRSHHKRRDANVARMRAYRERQGIEARREYRQRTHDTEKNTARCRRWAQENPEQRRALNSSGGARYRARKVEQFVEVVDPQVVWERDEGVCGMCGQAADRADWQLDHIVPISKGGEHSYANTQVSHPTCNRRKGAKTGD